LSVRACRGSKGREEDVSHCDAPLHGFTVVVETAGSKVYIGRYHSEDDEGLLLLDADVRELPDESARTAHLARSARYGVFKNTEHVRVPRAEIASVRRLVEYAAG
jgi:hypothetical protein